MDRREDFVARPTIRDISKLTGLSTYTISQALRGAEGVSDDSRARVLAAANDIGYIPNRAAQDLRRTNRDSVGLITASTSNSYYLDLIGGIQSMVQSLAWTVIIADVAVDGHYDPAQEDRTVRRLIEARVAGVISTLTLRKENTDLLSKWDIPVVFVDSSAPAEAPDLPSVTTDNYQASMLVGDHLAGHGYKHWLFLAYPAIWSTRVEREHGLRDAAANAGAVLTVVESANDAVSAAQALKAHLDTSGQLPDVLIAGNNPMLLGALEHFRLRGLSVPNDIAVVGYDEFAWSNLIQPPLTLLNERSGEIGQEAARTLSEIVLAQDASEKRGEGSVPVYRPEHQKQVGAELIVRQSCGCAHGRPST
ncbi:MAG: LacI family DNA-binding transcriptional regulator [Devosia sp.]|uniref:LacI family DNA-binding transcriptional regulator n=1 Tax=Devosia sp. TaxID=1871048 RepID=UPI00339AC644